MSRDNVEREFALDDTLHMLESALTELERRCQEGLKGVHSINAQRDAGDQLEMHVNVGGIVQDLGSRVERYVGQLDVLVRLSKWDVTPDE